MKNEFQYRLQKSLANSGMTAAELSEATGISEANISNYINGKYIAKQDKCFLLAKALNVDPGWLMTGAEPTTKDILRRAFEEYYDEHGSQETVIPVTPESRLLAKGMDRMPEALRKALMTTLKYQYPTFFTEGNENDDT